MTIRILLFSILISACFSALAQSKPEPFQDSKTQLYGYQITKGKKITVVVPGKYKYAYYFEGNYARVKVDETFTLINLKGEEVFKTYYEDIRSESYGLYTVKQKGKTGILDTLGKEILKTEFDYINIEKRLDAIIAKKENKYGLYSLKGENILPHEYLDIYTLGKYVGLYKDYKYGVSTIQGEILLPCQYSYVSKNGNLFQLRDNKKIGCADSSGKIIIPIDYDDISSVQNKRLYVKKTGKYGYFDEEGTQLTEILYDTAFNYGKHIARFYRDNAYGFIDSTGKEIAFGFEDAEDCNWYVCRVFKNKKFGYMDYKGEIFIPTIYDFATPSEDMSPFIVVSKNDKFGILNIYNENQIYTIDLDYEDVKIVPSLAMEKAQFIAKKNNFYGIVQYDFYVNSKKNLLNFEYKNIEFLNDLYELNYEFDFLLNKDGKFGIINSDLKQIIATEYEEIRNSTNSEYEENKTFTIKKAGKYGLITSWGKTIVQPIYDELQFDEELYTSTEVFVYRTKLNGKYGLLNSMFKEVLPCIFDSIVAVKDDYLRGYDKTMISYQGNYIQIYDYNFDKSLPKLCEKIDYEFGNSEFASEGWLKIKVAGKYGLYDIFSKKYRINPLYDELIAIPGHYESVIIKLNGKYGMISQETKKIKHPIEYDSFEFIEEDGMNKVKFLKGGIPTIVEDLD